MPGDTVLLDDHFAFLATIAVRSDLVVPRTMPGAPSRPRPTRRFGDPS
ncbi:hypothetical protein [Kribbella hippodromi]